MNRQGLERELYVYIPESYSENSDPVPLLFSLHGYTSRAIWNLGYTGFQSLADQENFIVIYPQGSILSTTGQTHWNVGGWTIGSNTDDVDFIESLIDYFGANYNIDLERVYSTGMSNGGFMSYHLACNLSSKISAIASVTGSMTNQTYNGCNPIHPTPILQIHGSSDMTVPYWGNSIMKPIPEVMDYWAQYNICNLLSVDDFFDSNGDGFTGDFYYYSQCLNNIEVHLWYLENFGHSWPSIPGDDIHGAYVIWNFLKRYDINGLINE
tara:strand:- start:124 stop:924 length:801 start_codon:yes stop_codon:yes gene_type:complete